MFAIVGGQGDGGQVYDVVSGYGSLELPFYMSLEGTGNAHGVLIETNSVFITQFVEAPGLLFHFQGSDVVIKLHFFVGPTPMDVFRQLHAYVRTYFT